MCIGEVWLYTPVLLPCKLSYFLSLLACPGHLSSPCSRNGQCDDGKSGSGHCQCTANFTGTACEKCIPGKYETNCSSGKSGGGGRGLETVGSDRRGWGVLCSGNVKLVTANVQLILLARGVGSAFLVHM